jgi:hypothetical protein
MMAKRSGSFLSINKLKREGTIIRQVKSPDPPKMANIAGFS